MNPTVAHTVWTKANKLGTVTNATSRRSVVFATTDCADHLADYNGTGLDQPLRWSHAIIFQCFSCCQIFQLRLTAIAAFISRDTAETQLDEFVVCVSTTRSMTERCRPQRPTRYAAGRRLRKWPARVNIGRTHDCTRTVHILCGGSTSIWRSFDWGH